MSDGKLAVCFFEIGLVLALISMVLGPFQITRWALAAAVCACFVALAGISFAFTSWNEPDAEPRRKKKSPGKEKNQ